MHLHLISTGVHALSLFFLGKKVRFLSSISGDFSLFKYVLIFKMRSYNFWFSFLAHERITHLQALIKLLLCKHEKAQGALACFSFVVNLYRLLFLFANFIFLLRFDVTSFSSIIFLSFFFILDWRRKSDLIFSSLLNVWSKFFF